MATQVTQNKKSFISNDGKSKTLYKKFKPINITTLKIERSNDMYPILNEVKYLCKKIKATISGT